MYYVPHINILNRTQEDTNNNTLRGTEVTTFSLIDEHGNETPFVTLSEHTKNLFYKLIADEQFCKDRSETNFVYNQDDFDYTISRGYKTSECQQDFDDTCPNYEIQEPDFYKRGPWDYLKDCDHIC